MLWMAWRGADGRLQRRARISCVKAAHLNGVADFQHFTATVLVQQCPANTTSSSSSSSSRDDAQLTAVAERVSVGQRDAPDCEFAYRGRVE